MVPICFLFLMVLCLHQCDIAQALLGDRANRASAPVLLTACLLDQLARIIHEVIGRPLYVIGVGVGIAVLREVLMAKSASSFAHPQASAA